MLGRCPGQPDMPRDFSELFGMESLSEAVEVFIWM